MARRMDVMLNERPKDARAFLHRQSESNGGFDKHGKSHTKHVVVFAFFAVIFALALGVVFQQFSPEQQPQVRLQGFSESYCISLLADHYPQAQEAVFYAAAAEGPYSAKIATASDAVDIIVLGTQDSRVAGCRAASVQASSVGSANQEYICEQATIRYKSEAKRDYLFLVKESELPEEIRLDNVVILDARELPRFSVEIAYMNPSERAYWEELLGELQRREC